MTKEEALHMSEVLKAWADGKEIEIEVTRGKWTKLTVDPNFRSNPYDYRIKAEPKLRPYTSAEEFFEMQKKHGMYLKWIDPEEDEEYDMFMPQLVGFIPQLVGNNGVRMGPSGAFYTWQELSITCMWQDGCPCGVYL